MRRILIAAVLLLIGAIPSPAANRIMIELDSVSNYQTEFFVPFLYENETTIIDMINGFTIAANGDITAVFGPDYELRKEGRFELTCIIVSLMPESDSILTSSAVFIPDVCEGLPAGPLEEAYKLEVLVGKSSTFSEGEICIDSAGRIGLAGDWLWYSYSENANPTFNDDLGTWCITYYSPAFICGDANYDYSVNVSDAVYIVNYVFTGGFAPQPLASGDSNCDGSVNVSDVVVLLNFIFESGYPPCDPSDNGFPDC